MRLFETKKLHHGKYLYKLVLSNPLATIFRSDSNSDKKLAHAKVRLDTLTAQHKAGEPLTKTTYRSTVEITEDAFFDAKDIYNILKKASDYKVRCESNTLNIYSSNRSLLMKISNKMRVSVKEFWEPSPEAVDLLSRKENLIIVNYPSSYQYQVHLSYKRLDANAYNWLKSNTDKVKVGPKTLKDIGNGFANGSYIYVRDDRVMSLVEMLIGHAIRKVDKIVYKGDIDKYKYDS
jgi:hypothetical protein